LFSRAALFVGAKDKFPFACVVGSLAMGA